MVDRELPPPAISFVVYGVPATKGNKSGFPIKRKNGSMGVAMREGKSKNFPDWTHRVDAVVQGLAESGAPLLDGPLVVDAVFWLPRPKTAPKNTRTWPDRRPDLGKYLRAMEDPMNGVLISDDARIVDFSRLRKDYAVYSGDDRPRAEIQIWRVADLQPIEGEEVTEEAAGTRLGGEPIERVENSIAEPLPWPQA